MSGPTKVVKTKLFIGNLDPATQTGKNQSITIPNLVHELLHVLGELSTLFAPFGNVLEASVIKDYGFVVRRENVLLASARSLFSILVQSKKQKRQS